MTLSPKLPNILTFICENWKCRPISNNFFDKLHLNILPIVPIITVQCLNYFFDKLHLKKLPSVPTITVQCPGQAFCFSEFLSPRALFRIRLQTHKFCIIPTFLKWNMSSNSNSYINLRINFENFSTNFW